MAISIAHLRAPEDALWPSAFSDGETMFINCFKFYPHAGLKLINLYAEAVNLNPVHYSRHSKYPFDITFFSTISYLVRGELNYLINNHATYRKYPKRELMREVPKICRKMILHWFHKLVNFPTEKRLIESRLKAFKDKMCPNIVGIMRVYNFRIKKLPVNEAPNSPSQISVQFVCDHRSRFNAMYSPVSPRIVKKKKIWRASQLRRIMMAIKQQFGEVYLVTLDDYPLKEDLLLTPNSPKLQGENRMRHDSDIQDLMIQAMYELKTRFMCLAGKLPFHKYEALQVLKACVVLHNLIIDERMAFAFRTYD